MLPCRRLHATAPELAGDIVEKGIMLTGGGALLGQIVPVRHRATGLPVTIAEGPLTSGARGAGRVLEDLGALKRILQD